MHKMLKKTAWNWIYICLKLNNMPKKIPKQSKTSNKFAKIENTIFEELFGKFNAKY